MDPKKQRLTAGILVALGVIVWIWGLTARPVRSKPSHAPSAWPPIQSGQSQAPPPSASRQSRYAEWGESPFLMERRKAAAATTTTGPSGPVLNGILWDPKVPSAIVNSRLVTVGDHLGPWQVIEIQKDRVILSDGATTKTLAVE